MEIKDGLIFETINLTFFVIDVIYYKYFDWWIPVE